MSHPTHTHSVPVVPLTSAVAGQVACVAVVEGGHGATCRLADLGLLPGHNVRMIRPSRGGPILVEVKGSRLALGHHLASKIMVRLAAERAAAE
ncbi:MAG: FeoA family protein [Phycisphaerae bacterium]|nr:FeoA family protein [Phycisphaerae bacterium]